MEKDKFSKLDIEQITDKILKKAKIKNEDGSYILKDSKIQKRLILLIALLTGVPVLTISAAVTAYDAFFQRYDRPDYSITPGLYNYELLKDTLPREVIKYKSDNVNLAGYFYKNNKNNKLVIVCHGLHAGADDYLPIIEYMYNQGYSVFAFDYRGTYDSEGDSLIGMCESLVDLDNTLTFMSTDDRFCGYDKYLIGHSWGGYAVTSVLSLHPEIKGCAAIAGLNNGYKLILEKGAQYAGAIADNVVSKVFLNTYQKILFGKYIEYDGVKGINSTNIPVLIAHGKQDNVISYDLQSIMCHKNEFTNPNVKFYDGEGVNAGHDSIWHSEKAMFYQDEITRNYNNLKKELGRNLNYDEKVDFYSKVDNRLYSDINKELFDEIIKIF